MARSPSTSGSVFRWPALLTAALLALLCATTAHAQNDWTGEWDTRWKGGGATLILRQTGDKVTGQSPLYRGRVEGTLSGRKLTGEWIEDQKTTRHGKFQYILSAD